MESKKRNKLGAAILCGLPPLSALIVTGVVIATTKPAEPVSEEWIIEPETEDGRHATSLTEMVMISAQEGGIKYWFYFPGTFKLNDSSKNISDLTASAKLTYTPQTGGSTVFDMTGDISVVSETDKTFSLNLYKTFTQTEVTTIWSIPADTNLTISDFKIINSADQSIYEPKKSYKATMVPNLLNTSTQGLTFNLVNLQDDPSLNESFMVLNSYTLPSSQIFKGLTALTSKETGWEKSSAAYEGYWKVNSDGTEITLYQVFETIPAAGSTTEIGFELKDDDGNVYFKKEIGKGPAIKIKVPE